MKKIKIKTVVSLCHQVSGRKYTDLGMECMESSGSPCVPGDFANYFYQRRVRLIYQITASLSWIDYPKSWKVWNSYFH